MAIHFADSSTTMFAFVSTNILTSIVLVAANFVRFGVNISRKLCCKIWLEGDLQFKINADGNAFWCLVQNHVLVGLNRRYKSYCACSSQLCVNKFDLQLIPIFDYPS